MYVFTQRLFPVAYEWRRLALVVLSCGGPDRRRRGPCLPTSGFVGLASRTVLWLAYPAVLYAIGFLHEEERSRLVALLRPSAIAARARSLRAASAPGAPRDGLGRGPRPGPEDSRRAARDEAARGLTAR